MATEVVMPQMGESIAEGTITKWLKKVGERVERDEPLFEISTDKVDAEIPSPAAGTLTEIRFQEGDTVEINTTVAVLDGGAAGESAPKAEAPASAGAPAEPKQSEAPPAQTEAAPPPSAQAQADGKTEAPRAESSATTAAPSQPQQPEKAAAETQPRETASQPAAGKTAR